MVGRPSGTPCDTAGASRRLLPCRLGYSEHRLRGSELCASDSRPPSKALRPAYRFDCLRHLPARVVRGPAFPRRDRELRNTCSYGTTGPRHSDGSVLAAALSSREALRHPADRVRGRALLGRRASHVRPCAPLSRRRRRRTPAVHIPVRQRRGRLLRRHELPHMVTGSHPCSKGARRGADHLHRSDAINGNVRCHLNRWMHMDAQKAQTDSNGAGKRLADKGND